MRWIRWVDQRLIGLVCGQLQVSKGVRMMWVYSPRCGNFHYMLVTKTWTPDLRGFIGKEGSIDWLIHARVDCYSYCRLHDIQCPTSIDQKKVRITITVPHGRTTAGGHEKGDLCYQPVIQTTTHHSCGVHSVLSVMSTTQHLDVSSEAHFTFMI